MKEFDNAIACDPAKSIIVSACAGSGKTWLLVARMIRLLLAGARPSEILALTFTRKAAQEMRERLYSLLQQFSSMSDDLLLHELCSRGLEDDQARALLPQARTLYSKVLASPAPIVIDTFHGWFVGMLNAAPISADVQPGFSLREDGKRLLEECLEDWWSDLPADLTAHYDVLLKYLGASTTDKFLMGNYGLVKQRGAWAFFVEACKHQGITPIDKLKEHLPLYGQPNPLLKMWNALNAKEDFEFLVRCFANSSTQENKFLPNLETAFACMQRGGDVLEVATTLQPVFITGDGSARDNVNHALTAVSNYLAAEGISHKEDEHVAYKQAWANALLEYAPWQAEQDVYALNHAWFAISERMINHARAAKEAMRVRDFDDLEIGVSQLMSDAGAAAYLQARLDAKYKHILVDEFQDTNPLQWQILRSWLEAYGHTKDRPSVFIVGDPKQSIYRFRRADPRLFKNAKAFLVAEMQAVALDQDVTRRNAPKINTAVNNTFASAQLPEDYEYHKQETLWKPLAEGLPSEPYSREGEAALLPLIPYAKEELTPRQGNAFDTPITDVNQTTAATQRFLEGQQIAQLIHEVLNTRQVIDEEGGRRFWRKARASDFLLLVKRRKFLPQFERALREANLAYDSSRLGGLLNTLEIDDLIALLTVLLSPRHDLSLAQVLRSPIFSFTDAQMQSLSTAKAHHPEYSSWWDALHGSADPNMQNAARFIEHWRVLAQRLPVHDLLDQIYQEGDLRFKYAASAQALMRAQVVANLDEFLAMSLDQDGGRYPSLGRFIEDINAMRRSDDDETPDEGDIESEAEADFDQIDKESDMSDEERHRRVRIMTIHGAKGLESPFVIILDANNTVGAQEHSGVLLDWSPHERSPAHLSMYTKSGLTFPRRQIWDEEERINQRENWNLLYVAMTRAKQGLWMSGVAKEPSTNNPMGLNQKSWYARALLGEIPVLEDMALSSPSNQEQRQSVLASNPVATDQFAVEDFQISWEPAKQSFEQQLIDIASGASVVPQQAPTENIADPEILEEGVHFHKLLEFLTPDSNKTQMAPMPTEQELMNWLDVDQAHAAKLLERTQKVLNTPELSQYLTSGQWIAAWNELDIASKEGKSYRMDRLVELEDHIAIIDYKLTIPEVGSEKYECYREKLQNYQAELSRIRGDKPNKAYLISSEGRIHQIG